MQPVCQATVQSGGGRDHKKGTWSIGASATELQPQVTPGNTRPVLPGLPDFPEIPSIWILMQNLPFVNAGNWLKMSIITLWVKSNTCSLILIFLFGVWLCEKRVGGGKGKAFFAPGTEDGRCWWGPTMPLLRYKKIYQYFDEGFLFAYLFLWYWTKTHIHLPLPREMSLHARFHSCIPIETFISHLLHER